MKIFANVMDGLVLFLGFWGVVTLFTMGGGVGSPEFLDLAAYVALWVFIPALMAAAAHRIAERS